MPSNLTLTNMPDAVYTRLKSLANAHCRSLNDEVVFCLETALFLKKVVVGKLIARARELRSGFAPSKFSARDIDGFKRRGRR